MTNNTAMTTSNTDTASAIIQLKSGALWMAFCRPPIAMIGAINARRSSRIDVI